jgi:hypothetical protein
MKHKIPISLLLIACVVGGIFYFSESCWGPTEPVAYGPILPPEIHYTYGNVTVAWSRVCSVELSPRILQKNGFKSTGNRTYKMYERDVMTHAELCEFFRITDAHLQEEWELDNNPFELCFGITNHSGWFVMIILLNKQYEGETNWGYHVDAKMHLKIYEPSARFEVVVTPPFKVPPR